MCKSTMFKTGAVAAALLLSSVTQAASLSGIGQAVTDAELVNWDISVFFDGEGLPEGSGTLEEGEEIWAGKCAMCHGDFGEGARGYPKMMGVDLEDFHESAVNNGFNVENRGINNLWAHAPTLFDMIRRAMPFFMPQSLSNNETYAVTGYALMLADIIDEDVETIDADFLRNLSMPTVDLYYTDTRPDVRNTRCMSECFDGLLEVGEKTVEGDFTGSGADSGD